MLRRIHAFHEIFRNIYDRTRVEFKRSLSIRHIGGQVWADQVHFPVFLASKNNWNFLISISWLGQESKTSYQISAKFQPYRRNEVADESLKVTDYRTSTLYGG